MCIRDSLVPCEDGDLVGCGDVDAVGPQRAGETVVEAYLHVLQEGAELLDADAQQIAQGSGVPAEVDVVVLVDDTRVVGGGEVAAAAHVGVQPGGEFQGHHVQDGCGDEVVAGEVGRGGDDVHPDPEGQEGRVPVERLLTVAHQGGRLGVTLDGPPGFPVEHQGRARRFPDGTGDRGECLQRAAEGRHGAEHLAVGPGVGHHRGVVLLGARGGLAPLEEADGVGSVGDVDERVAGQFALALGDVDGLPVDRARGVLHQEPGLALGDGVREGGGEGELVETLRAGVCVVVVGDEVDLLRPVRVVHAHGLAHHHEVGGGGDVRGDAAQDLAFGPEVVLQRVGGEALEVELLRRVGVARGQSRGQDLCPVAVVLGPEGGRPGPVELVQGAVACAQPVAEGLGRVVGVVVDVVAAELVGDVPGDHGGVVRVAGGHHLDQFQRVLPEDG